MSQSCAWNNCAKVLEQKKCSAASTWRSSREPCSACWVQTAAGKPRSSNARSACCGRRAGSVSVFGENSWDLTAGAKARLGYVPQEVTSYPWMRVRQVIAYTAAFYPRWNHAFVDKLCDQWHVPLEDRVGSLSTGQLQTVGIVLALGHQPELLVLDEPVASLDPSARRQFLRTLLDLLQDHQQTILFSTHITSDLERVAQRVAIMGDGKIRFYGELDDLKDRVKRLRITARHDLPCHVRRAGCTAVRSGRFACHGERRRF